MAKWLALALGTALVVALVGRFGVAEPAKPTGKLRHVVLFKFKDGTKPEDVQKLETAFRVLPTKIPQIAGFEWGTNNSPEKHDQGLTHCFFLTFNSAADRDAYLPHPAHKEFGKILGPHLDKVVVVDYFAQE